jgi:hypothetical protein
LLSVYNVDKNDIVFVVVIVLAVAAAAAVDVAIYRIIQEESAILWEIIVYVILSKKVHINMVPILNDYRDYGKKKMGPSCEY